MSANIETMFDVRHTPWHGLGKVIQEAPTSADAIKLAGLDWDVIPMPIYDGNGVEIPGYKVNTRSSDGIHLGIVTDRYKIVQNKEAFEFTDSLLGEGVTYETAGSLSSGKRVWMLAKLEGTLLAEEKIDPYLVFTNSHDGTGAIRVAITPIRVVCQNTLNLALHEASRHWSCVHKGDIQSKLDEARYTLQSASAYMKALEEEFGELKLKKVSDQQVRDMVDKLAEIEWPKLVKDSDETGLDFRSRLKARRTGEKLEEKKREIIVRYNDAPDLRETERTAFSFINAVSDFATHTTNHRTTANYDENLFMKTVDGNTLIDTAYKIALAA